MRRNEPFTRLFWWKQALYSPNLRRSYRGVNPALLVVVMPFDLTTVCGAPVPQSVEFFLRETVKAVMPANESLTLSDICSVMKSDGIADSFLPAISNAVPRRLSLREFLRTVRTATINMDAIPGYVGVEQSISLPISDWAIWVLRDRMAEILTQKGSKA